MVIFPYEVEDAGVYAAREAKQVLHGDCSGPQSGGILRSELGFDQCGVSIITNVSGDLRVGLY
jgi:hypothetical protein